MFRVFDGVVRRCWGDEICRDELGALVYKLVEGVLAVGTGGTPDDGLFVGGESRCSGHELESKADVPQSDS